MCSLFLFGNNMPEQLHYYLVTGSMLFRDPQDQSHNNVGNVNLNAVITSESKTVPLRLMNKANQALHIAFNQKVGTKLEIVDTVLNNFCYLGAMTQEEFYAQPDQKEMEAELKEALKDA